VTLHTLLFEIGCEELPSSFVDAALAALPDLVRARLAELRLPHGEIAALGTPRRLSVLVRDLAGAQADLDEEVVGPPETAAFKDGAPTKAAEAFATKLGVPVGSLEVKELSGAQAKKPGRYVVGRRQEKGRPARELLGPALEQVAGQIPFRKSMRWGSGDVAFGRPIQWLVALLDEEIVPVRFAGVASGRSTFGHRFLSPGPFDVKSASSYVETLRANHVLADRAERERTMMERVAAAAKAAGGVHDPDPFLVAENASLVEEPHVVTGSFDEAFLALPATVIRAVARGHQRYFVVQKDASDGSPLLPKYLAIAGTANVPANVAKGNDRTMRARLSDARFFHGEDLKTPADVRVEKLSGIVFHARLGTVREKVKRVEALAASIASRLDLADADREKVARAAHLAKNDLVSLMVGEFPELQGVMGRAYALAAGEDPVVADAIRDHYAPIGADGAIASSDVARAVALADRIDSLVACFAVGLAPTGTADPYALRRACIGILRTVLEGPESFAALDLEALFGEAYDRVSDRKLELERGACVAKVLDFGAERLRGILAAQTSGAVADAVLSGSAMVLGKERPVAAHPRHAQARAHALFEVVKDGAAWLEKARTVAKRLHGISKEHAPEKLEIGALSKPTDASIVQVVHDLDGKTARLETGHDVREALRAMEQVAERVDKIFVETLVNDPADDATPKRLALLSYGARCMLRLADFSRLG
jgi:glycyl-tRNA synthetase beta chain